jgi:hypothetical protein
MVSQTALMTPLYEVSAEAQNDLFETGAALQMTAWHWLTASKASFTNCSRSLGRMPGQGHVRKDLT